MLLTRHDICIGNWIYWTFVTTEDYNTHTNLHTPQTTRAYVKSLSLIVFAGCCLVVAYKNEPQDSRLVMTTLTSDF
jgi:hypothetical protein